MVSADSTLELQLRAPTLLILAVKQAAKVFIVDGDALPLATQEVGGVHGSSTAAIDGIKAFPAKSCVH